MAVILDYNPTTRVTETFEYLDDGSWRITRTQDVEPILDHNKAKQNEHFDKRKDWWPAASIPNIIIEKWKREDGIDVFNKNHVQAVKRKLNSNEYRWLRTQNFRI